MDRYIVDFSKVEHYYQIQEVLKRDLEFPDYYGGNLAALWDCLTDILGEPSDIRIVGFEKNAGRYSKQWNDILDVMRDTKHAYDDVFADTFTVTLVYEDSRLEEIK